MNTGSSDFINSSSVSASLGSLNTNTGGALSDNHSTTGSIGSFIDGTGGSGYGGSNTIISGSSTDASSSSIVMKTVNAGTSEVSGDLSLISFITAG